MPTKLSTFCDNLIEAGWLAVVIIIPLYFNIYSARAFEPDKIVLLRTIATLMVWAWLISALERKQLNRRLIQQSFKQPVILATGIFGLVYLISTILSLSPSISMWGSYQRAQGTYTMLSYLAIFAMLVSKLRTWQQFNRLLNTIIITTTPSCLYTVFEHWAISPEPYNLSLLSYRRSPLFGYTSFLASYLSLILPITFTYLISQLIPNRYANRTMFQRVVLMVMYSGLLVLQSIPVILSERIVNRVSVTTALGIISIILFIRLRQYNSNGLWLWMRGVGLPLFIMVIASLNYQQHFLESHQTDEDTTSSISPSSSIQLIWDGSIQLMFPHPPLGIPGDAEAVVDSFNLIRPLIGYGPEMMFNAYAFSAPPNLAHVDKRSSSVDRNHNETMDIFVTTGLLGLLAFYSVLISLITTLFKCLNLIPQARAQRWLIGCLIGGSIGGMMVAIGLDGDGSRLTMVLSLGLPFGLLSGVIGYLVGVSFSTPFLSQSAHLKQLDMHLIGIFGGFISYLILVHFQFAIASIYLYFWVYVGAMVAGGHCRK